MISDILIVDDSPAELALMTRLARDTFPGVQVSNASNAQSGQDACGRELYDCIILDFSMPVTDGLACAQHLRAAYPYLPIVMATGYGDEMLAARAVTSGATDYIPKSRMTVSALRRVVENAVRITDQARIIEEQRNELEQFSYALAHDFKQPIRQIKTFSGMLTQTIGNNQGDEVARYLSFLNIAANRLNNLVDAMTQYTLLSQQPEIGDMDLNAVLNTVRELLTPYLEERGGRLAFDPAPSVRGNEVLMIQVLENLVSNGLKYNAAAVPAVHIACEIVADRCLLRVRDNGIGIEPQYTDEIFKPLIRLHTSAEYPGTGLGLTLVRKALATMGGTISCTSSDTAGTEFTMDIGLAIRDDAGRKRDSHAAPPSLLASAAAADWDRPQP
jgi:signal transduction histidine kinase